MKPKHSQPQSSRMIHAAARWIGPLIGWFLLFGFAASEAQRQKITVDLNIACYDENGVMSGVNDGQIWIGGLLVDLGPSGSKRVEIAPGTYLIKGNRKSFPNAIVKDIYSSGPGDQFPRKYEPAARGEGISLALDKKSDSAARDYSMRIDLESCSPGSGPSVNTPTPTPTPPSAKEAKVSVFVTRMCKSDAGEEMLFPAPRVRVKIGDQEYLTDEYGSADIRLRQGQQYRVTTLAGTNTTGDPRQNPYELAYVMLGDEGEKKRPDPSGYVEVTLENKEYHILTFRLAADCNLNPRFKYAVLKVKGETIVTNPNFRKGVDSIEPGTLIFSGNTIMTGNDGAVMLQAMYSDPQGGAVPPPGGAANENGVFLLVHPNTEVQVFFYGEGDQSLPKFYVKSGTISIKKIIGPTVSSPGSKETKTITVNDPIMVGLDDQTVFSWSYDPRRQESSVSVEEGAATVIPKNPRLRHVNLSAGQQVQVTRNSVSAIRPASRISSIDYGNGLSLAKAGGTSSGPPDSGKGGSSSGIGGTWTTPTGDTLILTQTGNRVTGSYSGTLGTGSISGSFNGRTLSGTAQINQGLFTVSVPLILTLTGDGRLEGEISSPLLSVNLILTRR
jgi:hypothetical protein